MWTTFTNRVRKAFTDAADQYDILTSLHKEIGRELVKKTVHVTAERILDVGCGTGYAANKARFFFPESQVLGLDLAEGMLAQAQQAHEGVPIHWVQANAQRLPFKSRSIDLIVSNLAYQWVEDLAQSWKQAQRVLTDDGTMYVTLFGSRTFEEFFSSLRVVNPALKLRPLPSLKKVQEALIQAGFKEAKTDYELIKVQFKDVLELMGWLKSIGANHLAKEKFFLGKEMLQRADAHYKRHYPYHDGICATFEVIWVYARK